MTWMQTVSGTPFELMQPRVIDVSFPEVAHALSNICRFAGHVKEFYSVAEHCCRVADILPPAVKVYGLLHDAHEAFIGDVTTPVKQCLGKEAMKQFEGNVEAPLMQAIYDAANIPPPDQSIIDAVKYADIVLLMTERRDLMSPTQRSWGSYETIPPLVERIEPWNPVKARFEFIERLLKWTL